MTCAPATPASSTPGTWSCDRNARTGPKRQTTDGSSVVAQRVDGVTVDSTAIPWLLLFTVSTSAGSDGDRLTNTTFIQRTATTAGLAPAATDCNATTMGTTVEVPYTADYHFWKSTGH